MRGTPPARKLQVRQGATKISAGTRQREELAISAGSRRREELAAAGKRLAAAGCTRGTPPQAHKLQPRQGTTKGSAGSCRREELAAAGSREATTHAAHHRKTHASCKRGMATLGEAAGTACRCWSHAATVDYALASDYRTLPSLALDDAVPPTRHALRHAATPVAASASLLSVLII